MPEKSSRPAVLLRELTRARRKSRAAATSSGVADDGAWLSAHDDSIAAALQRLDKSMGLGPQAAAVLYDGLRCSEAIHDMWARVRRDVSALARVAVGEAPTETPSSRLWDRAPAPPLLAPVHVSVPQDSLSPLLGTLVGAFVTSRAGSAASMGATTPLDGRCAAVAKQLFEAELVASPHLLPVLRVVESEASARRADRTAASRESGRLGACLRAAAIAAVAEAAATFESFVAFAEGELCALLAAELTSPALTVAHSAPDVRRLREEVLGRLDLMQALPAVTQPRLASVVPPAVLPAAQRCVSLGALLTVCAPPDAAISAECLQHLQEITATEPCPQGPQRCDMEAAAAEAAVLQDRPQPSASVCREVRANLRKSCRYLNDVLEAATRSSVDLSHRAAPHRKGGKRARDAGVMLRHDKEDLPLAAAAAGPQSELQSEFGAPRSTALVASCTALYAAQSRVMDARERLAGTQQRVHDLLDAAHDALFELSAQSREVGQAEAHFHASVLRTAAVAASTRELLECCRR